MVEVINSLIKKYEANEKVDFSSLFIIHNAERFYLKDLYFFSVENMLQDNQTVSYRHVFDYNEFMHSDIFYDEQGLEVVEFAEKMEVLYELPRIDVAERVFDIDEDNNHLPDMTESKNVDIYNSLQPSMRYDVEMKKYHDNAVFNAQDYFLVEIQGKQNYYKAKDIIVRENSLQSSLNEYVLNRSHTPEDLAKCDIYVLENNQEKFVDKILIGQDFIAGKINYFEKLDGLQVKGVKVDDNFNQTETVIKTLDKYYAQINSIEVEIPDGKTTKQVKKFEVRNFQNAHNGKFVKLTLIVNGTKQEKMVNISSLKTLENLNFENLEQMIGSKLKYLDNDEVYETEPITLEQAQIKYSPVSCLQEQVGVDNSKIMAENAYLQLKNGEFIKEKNIEPICYKFVLGDDFDAYLFTTIIDGKEQTVIIDKSYIIGKSFPIHLSGITLRSIQDGRKISRCSMLNADVIQTETKNKKYFKSVVVSDNNALKMQALEEFKQSYINGEYEIDSVYVKNGETEKLEKLDPRKKRFLEQDSFVLNNYSQDTHTYSSIDGNNVEYVAGKNGKVGKIVGGPHYNVAKGISEGYKILWNSVFAGMVAMTTPLGLLVVLAPVVAAVAVSAAILAVPAIPIFSAIKGAILNRNLAKIKDQLTAGRDKQKKDIKLELDYLNSLISSKSASKNINLSSFIAKYSSLKQNILSLSSAQLTDGFYIKDKEIEVNKDNMHNVGIFLEQAKLLEKELKGNFMHKGLEKQYEKAKENYKKIQNKVTNCKGNVPEKLLEQLEKAKTKYEEIEVKYTEKKAAFDNMWADGYHAPTQVEKDNSLDKLDASLEKTRALYQMKCMATNNPNKLKEMLSDLLTQENIEKFGLESHANYSQINAQNYPVVVNEVNLTYNQMAKNFLNDSNFNNFSERINQIIAEASKQDFTKKDVEEKTEAVVRTMYAGASYTNSADWEKEYHERLALTPLVVELAKKAIEDKDLLDNQIKKNETMLSLNPLEVEPTETAEDEQVLEADLLEQPVAEYVEEQPIAEASKDMATNDKKLNKELKKQEQKNYVINSEESLKNLITNITDENAETAIELARYLKSAYPEMSSADLLTLAKKIDKAHAQGKTAISCTRKELYKNILIDGQYFLNDLNVATSQKNMEAKKKQTKKENVSSDGTFGV